MKRVVRPCPVCLNNEADILHHQKFAVPDGYALPDQFNVVACTACGMVFADTQATQDDYNRYYASQSAYQSPADSGSATPTWDLARLEAAARALGRAVENAGKSKATVRVCDIGCANGGLLEALRAEGFSGELTGIDPSAICVRNTRALGFEAEQGDLSSLPADAEYDVVVLTAVMEHVLDVRRATSALARICAQGGIVFVEVPDAVEYENFLHAPFQDFNTEHINHFSRASLRNLFRQFGFTRILEESHALTGAGGLRFPSLFAAYTKSATAAGAQPEEWDLDEEFRASIERYIELSSGIMRNLDAQLREALPSAGTPVVLYGVGQLAMKLLTDTVLRDRPIAAYADGNPVKAGQKFGGVPVVHPEDLPSTAGASAPIVVTTLLHTDGIRSRIQGLGLPNPILTLHR